MILISIVMVPIFVGWLAFLLALPALVVLPLSGGAVVVVKAVLDLRKTLEHGDASVVDAMVDDDGSGLVSFARLFPALVGAPMVGRSRVGEMLTVAQGFLPVGYRLKLTECFRSAQEEARYQDKCVAEILAVDPEAPKELLSHERQRLQKVFQESGHSTGGAFDVTLADPEGVEFDLGAREIRTIGMGGKLRRSKASREVMGRRKILADVLERVGFVGYSPERWHWSYGDKYWAVATGATAAVFGDQNRF